MDWAVGVGQLYGHSPEEIRNRPWRDVQLMLLMHMMNGGQRHG